MEKEVLKDEGMGLAEFDWEGAGEDQFFEETTPVVPKELTEEEKAKKKETEVSDDPEKTAEELEKEKAEAAADASFFEEEAEPGKEGEGEIKSEDQNWADIFKEQKESGVFKHVELEEGEELTEEKFFELQQEEYELEVAERVNAWATEELDEDARAFIKFKTEGGTTEDFFKIYKNSGILPEGDIEKDSYQDEVIRFQLSKEGWDAEEIEDRLKYLTDNGTKARIATKYNEKLEQAAALEKQNLVKEAAKNKELAKQRELDYKESVRKSLEETSEVKGFQITKKDKTDVLSFLTAKSFKTEDNRSITGFQKKLGEIFQEPEKMILLAKILKSDFDMSSFEKTVVTKKAKEIKSNLESRRGLRTSVKPGSKSLADLF